jgi:hypothetical protein
LHIKPYCYTLLLPTLVQGHLNSLEFSFGKLLIIVTKKSKTCYTCNFLEPIIWFSLDIF